MKILDIQQKYTANDYPYGYRNKTTAYYSIEFSPTKGFRGVFQTINPHNGKLNAPKKTTYNNGLMYVRQGEEQDGLYTNSMTMRQAGKNEDGSYKKEVEIDGKYFFGGLNIRGYEDVNKMVNFLEKNFTELNLTSEMVKYIACQCHLAIRVSAGFCIGKVKEEYKEMYKDNIKIILDAWKNIQTVNDLIEYIDYCKVDIETLKKIEQL